ncbi:hypothetical protein B5F24_17305 [Bacteroides clarus]|uniref:Uncharacterized protein n=1 Tax=Bacteroides clarus TaxID=626929 RepID=A0A1Y4JK68_9BACE|nr:hypothetical protein B5F24_17305 [Bacteroides clarus]
MPNAIDAPFSASYISSFSNIKYCIAGASIIIIFFKVYLKIACFQYLLEIVVSSFFYCLFHIILN